MRGERKATRNITDFTSSLSEVSRDHLDLVFFFRHDTLNFARALQLMRFDGCGAEVRGRGNLWGGSGKYPPHKLFSCVKFKSEFVFLEGEWPCTVLLGGHGHPRQRGTTLCAAPKVWEGKTVQIKVVWFAVGVEKSNLNKKKIVDGGLIINMKILYNIN